MNQKPILEVTEVTWPENLPKGTISSPHIMKLILQLVGYPKRLWKSFFVCEPWAKGSNPYVMPDIEYVIPGVSYYLVLKSVDGKSFVWTGDPAESSDDEVIKTAFGLAGIDSALPYDIGEYFISDSTTGMALQYTVGDSRLVTGKKYYLRLM